MKTLGELLYKDPVIRQQKLDTLNAKANKSIKTSREKAIDLINSWSDQKKAENVAFYRTKGFTCNDEEEIITATIATFFSSVSTAKAFVDIIQVIIALVTIGVVISYFLM